MYRMTLKKTALSLVLAVLIAACAACKQTNYIPVDVPSSQAEQSTAEKVNGLVSGILSLKEKMDARSATVADDRFLHWVADTYGSDALSSVADSLESGRYTADGVAYSHWKYNKRTLRYIHGRSRQKQCRIPSGYKIYDSIL